MTLAAQLGFFLARMAFQGLDLCSDFTTEQKCWIPASIHRLVASGRLSGRLAARANRIGERTGLAHET
jgi:hypothetical protein